MLFELLVFHVALLLLAAYARPPFQYYIKFFIFMYMNTVISFIMIPIFLLRPVNNKNLRDTGKIWALPKVPLGVKYQIRGREHIKPDKEGVIVINHQSAFDAASFSEIVMDVGRTTIVGRSILKYLGPWGVIAILCDGLFIDRSKGKETMNKIRECMVKVHKTKSKVLFFPEGTRNDNGSLLPFKAGAFKIAIENNLPIMPIVISPYYFINHKEKIFDSGKVIFQALPEISTEGLTVNDIDSLKDKTREVMLKAFESLKREVESEEFRNPSSKSDSFWRRILGYFTNINGS